MVVFLATPSSLSFFVGFNDKLENFLGEGLIALDFPLILKVDLGWTICFNFSVTLSEL